MRKFFRDFLDAFRKGDLVLMTLCMLTTAFGCVIIASATNYMDATRYILIQLVAAALGIILYILISSADLDSILEHRAALVLFGVGLILQNAAATEAGSICRCCPFWCSRLRSAKSLTFWSWLRSCPPTSGIYPRSRR